MKNFHLEKVGLAGSIVTLLCCLGFGPLLAVLGAIGAGFLINDRTLAPLLAFFLALGAAGLALSFRQHHRWYPLLLHLGCSILVLVFTFVLYFQVLVWLGLLGIVASVVWDIFLKRQHFRECTAFCPPASQEEKHDRPI
ncbi:MAG: MerC domain-containing protein [Planctomycetes bacterium]|nr:MerC domain-containing protein [Planctomycetota bacterium]